MVLAQVIHKEAPLSCNTMKSFWMSWFDDRIRVGKGSDVGYNEFMLHQGHPWYAIHAASISTGFGVDGKWMWPLRHGKFIAVLTPKLVQIMGSFVLMQSFV